MTEERIELLQDPPLDTPVLFLVFNRPEKTRMVFQAIRRVRPRRLYVAADGPRDGHPGDDLWCRETRRIATAVDWDCDVKLLFRQRNLGCKLAISESIDWFFEVEDEGIILEDDCLPCDDFFWFCQTLLRRFRGDCRVGQINGTNILGSFREGDLSLHFASFGAIWGWATWRRAWRHYDREMELWPSIRDSGLLKGLIPHRADRRWRTRAFERTHRGLIDTWDFQWIFARLIQNMLIVIPHVNLVSNIGFDSGGTHTRMAVGELENMARSEMDRHIVLPPYILPNRVFERRVFERKRRHWIKARLWGIMDLAGEWVRRLEMLTLPPTSSWRAWCRAKIRRRKNSRSR